MLLEHYTKVAPSAFNRLAIPEITEPVPIHIHWFHTVDRQLKNYPVNYRPHSHSFFEVHFMINGQSHTRVFCSLCDGFARLLANLAQSTAKDFKTAVLVVCHSALDFILPLACDFI